jgi:hypothetical protein
MTLHPIPLNFLIYEENIIFFFISAHGSERGEGEECAGGGGGAVARGKGEGEGGMESLYLSLCPH